MALTGYEVDAMRALVSIAKTLRDIERLLREVRLQLLPEPDTSDIPETSKEFFDKAKLVQPENKE